MRRSAALVAPAVALAALVTVVLIGLAQRGESLRHSFGDEVTVQVGLGSAVAGLVVTLLSALVLRHGGHRSIGWALAGVGLFWTVDGLSETYVRWGLVSDEPLPGLTLAAWLLLRFNSLLPASIVVLPLLFPDGRFLPGRWRVASWACMAVMVLGAVAYMVTPYPLAYDPARLPPGLDLEPTTIWSLEPVGDAVTGGLAVASLVGLVVPVGVVVTRYRRSTGTARDQMRWLLWGALVAASLVLATAAVDLGPLTAPAFFLVILIVPASMAVAVINPRVVPIDQLLGHTLVLAGLSVVLVAVDLAVIAGLTAVLGESLEERQVVLVVLLLTFLLYAPLRQRLSRWGRRLVLGERADPYDAVARLASALETTDEGSEQLAVVARSVASAFGVAYVSVEVDRSGGERLVATYGVRPAEVRTLPIAYRGAEVGRLVLPARGLRSRLTRRDEELLGDLVRQAATAARSSQLAEELQESRERLVTAREEERRRIRRDLHDGLGPALSGMVFQLEGARLLVDRDPERAKQEIGVTSRLVQDVVADVRRLVHDLRPPALDDLGLAGALRQQAELLSADGLSVTVRADDLGVLPAAVEVAAYRIAAEALTNVVRHSGASRAEVGLRVEGPGLLVEVVDDGVGIPAEVQAGVGLLSLRERAAELGGRTEVTCPATGGTTVRAWLPMGAAAGAVGTEAQEARA